MICNFMIFSESVGSGASLSAIKLVNQGIAKIVHEFVHESPIFWGFFVALW